MWGIFKFFYNKNTVFLSTVVFGEKVMKNGSNPLQKFITL